MCSHPCACTHTALGYLCLPMQLPCTQANHFKSVMTLQPPLKYCTRARGYLHACGIRRREHSCSSRPSGPPSLSRWPCVLLPCTPPGPCTGGRGTWHPVESGGTHAMVSTCGWVWGRGETRPHPHKGEDRYPLHPHRVQ